VFSDGIQAGATGWGTAASPGFAAWTVGEVRTDDLALVGPDLAIASQSLARLSNGIAIPAGTTYLEFEHAFQFDFGTDSQGNPAAFYDGGQVYVSTSGAGGPYSNIASLSGAAIANGYNHVVTYYTNDANAMAGSAAFTAESPG